MTYSIYIPMSDMPNATAIEECVAEAFLYFKQEIPVASLTGGGDPQFQGPNQRDVCWVSVMFFEPEIREVPEYEYMGGVNSRGNWWFAGVVAYALAKAYGHLVFNDSGADLGVPGIYTVEEFEKILWQLSP